MSFQRPLTSRTKKISKSSTSLNQNRASNSAYFHRPSAFSEKKIIAARDKEYKNLIKWQEADKYFRQTKARLDLFENWERKEQNNSLIKKSKSIGNDLNKSDLNEFNNLFGNQNLIQQLNNQQFKKNFENQLCEQLYTVDPRKVPYDLDLELIKKPFALDELKNEVKENEKKLRQLNDEGEKNENIYKNKNLLKNKLKEDQFKLKSIFNEWNDKILIEWQSRLDKLELNLCDFELLYPARKGQVKAKDRLRLRNNLINEHIDHCRQMLKKLCKISGHIVKCQTSIDKNNKKKNIENKMQLTQLLNDDEIKILSNIIKAAINMLNTYSAVVQHRTTQYSSLFDEEAKFVWTHEKNEFLKKIDTFKNLVTKLFQLYHTIYTDKINYLTEQEKICFNNVEKNFNDYNDLVDNLRNNILAFNLIEKSLLVYKEFTL